MLLRTLGSWSARCCRGGPRGPAEAAVVPGRCAPQSPPRDARTCEAQADGTRADRRRRTRHRHRRRDAEAEDARVRRRCGRLRAIHDEGRAGVGAVTPGKVTYPAAETYVFPPTGETSRVYMKPFKVTQAIVLGPEARKTLATEGRVQRRRHAALPGVRRHGLLPARHRSIRLRHRQVGAAPRAARLGGRLRTAVRGTAPTLSESRWGGPGRRR